MVNAKTIAVRGHIKRLLKEGIARKDVPDYLVGLGYANPRGKPYSKHSINQHVFQIRHGVPSSVRVGGTRGGRMHLFEPSVNKGTEGKTRIQFEAGVRLIAHIVYSSEEPNAKLDLVQDVLDTIK